MFVPDYSDAVQVIDSSTGATGTVFEVIEYKKPRAGGSKLRQVRISLKDSAISIQPGALHFMKGDIAMEVVQGAGGAVKGFFASAGTGESSVTTRYSGKQGEIYLEPSGGHFYLVEMDNEEIILDDGMFFACEDTIKLSVHVNKNVATGLLGGDGFKQPKLSGSGVAVLECNVPVEEILMYELNNETLKVDGKFALVIRGNVTTRIEKSSKSLLGTARSGEGLLQVFSGTGEVWLAPTRNNLPAERSYGALGTTI